MATSHHGSSQRPRQMLAASLWLASSALFSPASGHALPRRTAHPTATQEIQPWPLPTPGPNHAALVNARRQFNTICGYIGGNPDLPATCLPDSHCVVDAQNKAIGCCPDDGDCTTGIFTGCADENNPGNGVVDPHIFTCGAGDVCYKNTFEGGFFQYGCGSASDLATNVALTASGQADLSYMSVSVSLRPTTTLASLTSTDGTSSRGPSSTSGGMAGASNTPSPEDGGSSHTGAIVGGVIGGLAAILLLFALGFWLWRHNKGSRIPEAEDEPKFIRQVNMDILQPTQSAHHLLTRHSRPLASPENDYEDEMIDARPAPKPPAPAPAPLRQPEDTDSWPIPPASRGGAVGGGNNTTDTDRTPLTQDNALSPSSTDNFSPVDTGSMPRRGGERPFWQQTGGGRTRNLTRS